MNRLLILLFTVLSLSAYAQQKKVAVYVTGQQSGINKVLGDKLVEAFAKSGKYIAIERTSNFLAELSKEQNYQRTGAVDDNELSRLGKQFGVQLVCVADISEVFGQKYVSARLINVESAEVVNTSNTNSKLDNMGELLEVADKIAKELTDKTVQEKAEEALAKQKAQAELIKKLEKAVSDGYIQVDNIMFVVTTNIPEMTFKEAEAAAKECRIGGYNGWRLPTISEMTRIFDISQTYHSICSEFPAYRVNYSNSYGLGNNYHYTYLGVKKGWGINSYKSIFVRGVPSN